MYCKTLINISTRESRNQKPDHNCPIRRWNTAALPYTATVNHFRSSSYTRCSLLFAALNSPTDMTENAAASPAATAPEVVTSSLTSSPASTASVSATTTTTGNGTAVKAELCAGCRLPITERYLLRALDSSWHEDCLRCSCCDCRLGEVGSTLFTRSNLLLCRRDYLRSVY